MGLTVTPTEGGSAAWAQLAEGTYGAKLSEYVDLGMQSYQGGPEKQRIAFHFALDGEQDEDGQPVMLKTWANLVMSPKSNLAKLADDLGVTWSPGTPFSLDSLVGRRCQVVVKMQDGPNGPRPAIVSILKERGGQAPTRTLAEKLTPAVGEAECCLPSCHEPYDRFDGDGNPFCAQHAPKA